MNITNRDWILSYLDYLREGNLNEAINLKIKHFPKSLFKYRKLESRTIENLKNGKIWMAEIESLNDPFECSIQFDNNACLRLTYSGNFFYKNLKINSVLNFLKGKSKKLKQMKILLLLSQIYVILKISRFQSLQKNKKQRFRKR